jgi:hypothetical protein
VEIFHDTTYEAEDSITWTHGKHSIHAGFEFYHYIMNDVYAGNQGAAGSFNFNGQYTGNTAPYRQPLRRLPARPAATGSAGRALQLPSAQQPVRGLWTGQLEGDA